MRGANWQFRVLTAISRFFQDNWHPALQDLVASIGKRFSEAFDRESSLILLVQSPLPRGCVSGFQASDVRANCNLHHTTTMKNGQSRYWSSSAIQSNSNN